MTITFSHQIFWVCSVSFLRRGSRSYSSFVRNAHSVASQTNPFWARHHLFTMQSLRSGPFCLGASQQRKEQRKEIEGSVCGCALLFLPCACIITVIKARKERQLTLTLTYKPRTFNHIVWPNGQDLLVSFDVSLKQRKRHIVKAPRHLVFTLFCEAPHQTLREGIWACCEWINIP